MLLSGCHDRTAEGGVGRAVDRVHHLSRRAGGTGNRLSYWHDGLIDCSIEVMRWLLNTVR